MKKLERSKDKMIAGVCGGVGKYLGLDPTLVRILWACSILIAGTGALAYIICWIIIPEEQ